MNLRRWKKEIWTLGKGGYFVTEIDLGYVLLWLCRLEREYPMKSSWKLTSFSKIRNLCIFASEAWWLWQITFFYREVLSNTGRLPADEKIDGSNSSRKTKQFHGPSYCIWKKQNTASFAPKRKNSLYETSENI